MKNHILFELGATKKTMKFTFLAAIITQLASLYFFTIVGQSDASSTDLILKEYSGLSSLATTIFMCGLAIYGIIVINYLVVTNYIGDSRIRMYSYPGGRGQLYYVKNIAFLASFSLMQFLGMLLADTIYALGEGMFPILTSELPIRSYFVVFVMTIITGTLLTALITIISSFVGIYLASPVATIVTGIILIACLGNLIAMSFVTNQYIAFAAAICMSVLAFFGAKGMGERIDRDEVF